MNYDQASARSPRTRQRMAASSKGGALPGETHQAAFERLRGGNRKLAIFMAYVGKRSQHRPSYRSPYPAPRKLCVLLLLLCPYKQTP